MKPSINDFICLHHTDKERELLVTECPVCAILFKIQEMEETNTELQKLLDRANHKLADSEHVRRKIIDALPDPEKLRILARHFDLQDLLTGSTNHEIQDDLYRWATSAETLINKYKQPDESTP